LQLGYYFAVRSSILILCLALLFVPILPAQIHGVPPSVTSLGPGRGSAPGVPASVTSLGPNGFEPDNQFFQFPQCCMNPLFPLNPNPPLFRRRHHPVPFFPVAVPVYTMPYYPEIVSAPVDDSMEEEDYRGGPQFLIVAVPVSGDLKIGETKIAEIEMTVVETIPDTLTGEMMIGETTSGLVEKTR